MQGGSADCFSTFFGAAGAFSTVSLSICYFSSVVLEILFCNCASNLCFAMLFCEIVLQLVFLLSPILYEKKNLGAMAWTANLNPLYRVLSPVRHTLMTGELQWLVGFAVLLVNVLGLWISIRLLNRDRRNIPFWV